MDQTCSAVIAEAEARETDTETKSVRDSILDKLPDDKGQRVADYVKSISKDRN